MNYRDRVIARLDGQINKGKTKYGMTLEDNVSLNMRERLDHLAEELIDGVQYIEHLHALEANRKETMQELAIYVNNLILMISNIENPYLKGTMNQQVGEINRLLKELYLG